MRERLITPDWDLLPPANVHWQPPSGSGQKHALRGSIDAGYVRGYTAIRKRRGKGRKEPSRKQRRLECQATLAVLRGERPEPED